MPLKVYIKEDTAAKLKKAKKRDRTFFGSMAAFGAFALIFAAWPFVAWQLKTLPKLTAKVQNAPIPAPQVLSTQSVMGQDVQILQDADGFSYFSTTIASESTASAKRPKEYTLSIPRLKIKDAKVVVDAITFDNNLGQFPGTPIPGEVGNTFITGHSVLPQFADPKNYRAIFTKLPDLEVGDDVFVKVGDQNFHYMVQYSKVVDPKDLSVLGPISTTGRNLTLMTCVPPGSATKRLVVITSLI